ncbi:hypothetical protein [Gallibacterium salpingitidis]|nr:hypothetical protein [Gallibacterium salpingitidis]
MNILLFSLFTFSLRQKMSIIEHFARLQMPDLPDTAVRYTRNVTKVWSLFFFLNGSIALYTVYSDDLILWTLYNGLISYVLMGILFTGEYLFRRYKQSRFSD